MNDVTPYWKKYVRLTEPAALALLQERIPGFKCLACGYSGLEVLGEPSKNQATRENIYSYPEHNSVGFAATIIFGCLNCGFLHHFLLGSLDLSAAFIEGGE